MMRIRVSVYIFSIVFLAFVILMYFWRFPFSDMDWNIDGKTEFSEIFHSRSIGVKIGWVNQNLCTEYFSLDDGLPVKLVCPGIKSITNIPEIQKLERPGHFVIFEPQTR